MTKQDRTTLKSFFRDGALPSAERYGDLIDSTVNQIEDGFSKTPADGLRLSSVGESRAVMSLYQGLSTPYPSWILEHGEAAGSLHFRQSLGLTGNDLDSDAPEAEPKAGAPKAPPAPSGLTLSRDGRLGVHSDAPEWRLDVGGVARMQGRIGQPTEGLEQIPADGGWHDVTRSMTGCQAFEVMAGAGGEVNYGRYSMVHAIAMNAYHPRNPILNWLFRRRRIRSQTAMYGSYADRIRLRWVAASERHHFKLQMRTNANFGEGKTIRYYMTRLWFDPTMSGSRGGPTREGGVL